MRSAEAFSPDWASAPGDTMSDILREQNISENDFAQRIGHTNKETSDLLRGRSPITIALARRLEQVLGGSVEFWMSRDFQYRQQVVKPDLTENSWLKDLPVADMVRFGWLRPQPKVSEQLTACLSFFGVPNVAAWRRVYGPLQQRFAFRTSPSFESRPAAVCAWLRQGELLAQEISCGPWDAQGFEAALPSIRLLTREKEPKRFMPTLQSVCAKSGVAVVIVRSPSGCHASGATRFVASDKALLLLSFRHLSDDQFWFSFFHEAGHLLLHSHREVFIEGLEGSKPAAEFEANEFSSRILIPPEHRPDLLRLRQNAFDLARFARRIGVSPGIVVGQLQHYGKVKQNHFNGLRRRYTWE